MYIEREVFTGKFQKMFDENNLDLYTAAAYFNLG